MTPVRCFVVLLFLLTFPVCVRLGLPLFATAALLPVYVYVSRSSFPGQMFTFLPLYLSAYFSRSVFLALELVLVRLVPLPWVSFQFTGEFQENKLIMASGASLNNFHEYMTHLARCFPLRFHRPDHSCFNQTNLVKRLPAKCLIIKSNHLCNFLCTASADSLSPCSSLSSSACSRWFTTINT